MWIITWVEGVNEADADMATTQAALKGAPRRLQVLKEPWACATDAAATVVLTRGLFTRDGTAVHLRAGAEDGGGCVDRSGDCRQIRQPNEEAKPGPCSGRPPSPCSVQADSCPGPFGHRNVVLKLASQTICP